MVYTALPSFAEPRRLLMVAAIVAAVAVGLMMPLIGDLKLLSQGILVVGMVGLCVLAILPNRRICLVCAWVFVLPLSLEKIFPILKSSIPHFFINPVVISGVDIVFTLLLVSTLLEGLILEKKIFFWSGPATLYCLLAIWVCVLYFAKAPTSEGLQQVMHWVKMAIVLIVLTSAIRTREELMLVLLTVAAAILIQSAILGVSYVFKQRIGFSPKAADGVLLAVSGGGTTITRATGTVGHSNQQAMYQALFTIPLAALFMVRNGVWRLVMAGVLCASFCAILLTFSRASWLSCGLAASVIIFTAWRHGRISQKGWLGIYGAALAGLVIVAGLSAQIITRVTKADDGASKSRIHLAMLALEHVGKNPVGGVGPGNFINAKLAQTDPLQWTQPVWLPRNSQFRPRFIDHLELGQVKLDGKWYYSSLQAHNKYLLVAAELGLVGLGLFMWFQWRLLVGVLRGMRHTSDTQLWWIGVALLGAFAATHLEFMLELFYDDKTVLMPLFINVLMICFARIALEHESRSATLGIPTAP